MSLSEVMSSLKYAINSSIGTPDFKTLDQLIKGQNVDLSGVADKSTLDSLVLKVGNTDDLGGGYQTGSISAKLNNVINSISSINTNVNNIKTVTDTINANVNAVANKIPGGLQATLGAINTHAGDANTNAYNASVKADTIINNLNTIQSKKNLIKVKREQYQLGGANTVIGSLRKNMHTIPSIITNNFVDYSTVVAYVSGSVYIDNSNTIMVPYFTIGEITKSGSTYYLSIYYDNKMKIAGDIYYVATYLIYG